MIADMAQVDVLVAHRDRVVVRVGDVFVKLETDDGRLDIEVDAMAKVEVPTPAIAWRRPHALATRRLAGRPIAEPGEPSPCSTAAWAAAGEVAARIHDTPIVDDLPWELDRFAEVLDDHARMLVDLGIDLSLAGRVRRRADVVLRRFERAFTHGDLGCLHVFVDGDRITGVIDWSDAGIGDPLWDVAVLTCGHAEHLDDVERGYGTVFDRELIAGWWAVRRLFSIRFRAERGYDITGDVSAMTATA